MAPPFFALGQIKVEVVINLRYNSYLSNSQNFLRRILQIFVTLGLKLLILKEVFETDILKILVLITLQIIRYLFSLNTYSIKASQSYKKFTILL